MAFQPTFPTLCGLPRPLSLLPDCICIISACVISRPRWLQWLRWLDGRTNLNTEPRSPVWDWNRGRRAEFRELSSAFCRNGAQQSFWAASFCIVEVQKWWRLRSFNRNLCDFGKQKQTFWEISDYNGSKSDWMSICWEVVASKQMWMCFHYMVGFIYLSNITRTRLVRIF